MEFTATRGMKACDVLVDDWIEIAGNTFRVVDIGKVDLNLTGMDHTILVLTDAETILKPDEIVQLFLPKNMEITIKNQAR